jgi:6-phosphofructokinase 1
VTGGFGAWARLGHDLTGALERHKGTQVKIGILTSGGDCPGLNAVIRGAVLKGDRVYGQEFAGFRYGWRGVVNADIMPLDRHSDRGLSRQGGTILGSSRTNPFEGDGSGPENIQRTLDENGIDAIIAIGGEGTLTAARRLTDAGLKIVGVPKTIDNDLAATDYSFGFDTAVEIATEAIDRLRTTAESHQRCMIVEVMGRHVGWIALHSGMAGGAHAILIPEQPQSIDQICEWVESVRTRGRAPVIVVSEGFHLDTMEGAHSHKGLDAFNRPRLGGIGELLAPIIEERTGIESRATVIGHIQRGGVPSAYDRVLATRLGMSAIDAVQNEQWGTMVSLRGTDVVNVSIADATVGLNTVPQHRYDEAALLFG